MSSIVLPKVDEAGVPFVSYSQLSKWRRSKSDYMKTYFFNEPFEGNDYTDFGSKVGEALETGNLKGFRGNQRKVLESVPRLDEFEREIKLDFGEFYIKGFIDTNDSALTRIIDYKTGAMKKKVEYEADEYDQVQIYAMAIEQETGKRPNKGEVILIERVGNPFKNEKLKVGNEVLIIDQPLDDKSIDRVKDRIIETVHDISRHYQAFLKLTEDESLQD